ncbi:hypothetical protein [Falsibacillus pallidus]|uniref:hypothetical protein n=1 Tax=Falsibacillus pallidus TaxID=493781 RepID=UPI003D95CF8F
MKIHKWLAVGTMSAALLVSLAACSDGEKEEKKTSAPKTEQKASEGDTSVPSDGKMQKPPIKEAANIPNEESLALLKVVDEHFQAFNNEDLDAYMNTISKNPKSFKYDEEKEYLKNTFDHMDIKMNPKNTIIMKYDEKKQEANVFTEIATTVTDPQSKQTVNSLTRQINTFHKENGEWKMIATYAMEEGSGQTGK